MRITRKIFYRGAIFYAGCRQMTVEEWLRDMVVAVPAFSEHEFKKLVTDSQRELKQHAKNFTKNAEDAKDLLQETNIILLTSFKKYTHQGKFIQWAVMTMRNFFYNEKTNPKRIIEVELNDRHTVLDYESDALIELPKTPKMQVMVECLVQVNETINRRKFRNPDLLEDIWKDKYLHGMKIKDIAAKHGIAQGSISSLLYQRSKTAQNKLQENLLLKENG